MRITRYPTQSLDRIVPEQFPCPGRSRDCGNSCAVSGNAASAHSFSGTVQRLCIADGSCDRAASYYHRPW